MTHRGSPAWRSGELSGLMIGVVFSLVAMGCHAATAQSRASDDERGRVIYNLDCTEYFMGTFGPNEPETIDKFVEDHAAAGITDLWINVNSQRTNYRSDVWEAYWDGYDPDASSVA